MAKTLNKIEKFNKALVDVETARNEMINEVQKEIDKILEKYSLGCGLIIDLETLNQLNEHLYNNNKKQITVNYQLWVTNGTV